MIKAIALDDEPLPLRLLKTFSQQAEAIELVAAFTSPVEAKDFINKHKPDLIFLDIQMPGVSGIDFMKSLQKGIMVIFTTAFSEYAVDGFNLNAVDYLLKPFEYDRFLQAVTRAQELLHYKLHSAAKENAMFIKADHGVLKVVIDDILYVEGLSNYLKIYFRDKRTLLLRMSMKDMTEKLAGHGFMRVHRSYIVPLAQVISIRNRIIYLGYMEIPIGVNYIKEVQQIFGDMC